MNFDLKLFNVAIKLGENIVQALNVFEDEFEVLDNETKKMIGASKEDKIYFAKNCLIQCFKEKFTVSPLMDLDLPADRMFGTSSYLLFINESLYKVIFQIIASNIAAEKYAKEFRKLCHEQLGNSIEKNEILEVWEDEDSIIMSEWSRGSENSYFYWEIKTDN